MVRKKEYQSGFFLVLKIQDDKDCKIADQIKDLGKNTNNVAGLEKSFRFIS